MNEMSEPRLVADYLAARFVEEVFSSGLSHVDARRKVERQLGLPPFDKRGKDASYSVMRDKLIERGEAASEWYDIHERKGDHRIEGG